MSIEDRVRNLLRAAERAEREGNGYLASTLRKMARELGPPNVGGTPAEAPSTSQ